MQHVLLTCDFDRPHMFLLLYLINVTYHCGCKAVCGDTSSEVLFVITQCNIMFTLKELLSETRVTA